MSYPIDFNDLQERVHKISREHGFWDYDDVEQGTSEFIVLSIRAADSALGGAIFAQKIALIQSEASEALEAHREGLIDSTNRESDGKPEGVPSELADIVIRIMDLCEAMNINLIQEIIDKVIFNESRPFKHGKAY